MAPLYYSPAMFVNGEAYWLPVPVLRWRTRPVLEPPTVFDVPLGALVPKGVARVKGYRIQMSGVIARSTVGAALAELALMREAALGDGGGLFDLYRFHDRKFASCLVQSGPDVDETAFRTQEALAWDMEVLCTGGIVAAPIAFSSYDDDYPYAALVGRPTGDALSGSGPEVQTMVRQSIVVTLHGEVTATAAGQEIRVPFPTGLSVNVVGVAIANAVPVLGSGSTRVGVANYAPGGSGQSITATLAAGARQSALATGSFTVNTTSGYVYVWADLPSSGGGVHQDVEVVVHFRI